MNTVQNTPHHMYTVGDHIIHSLTEIEPDKCCRLTMLFHDMGKPAASFEDGEVRHFYGHAHVSVELGRGIMTRFLMAPAFRDRVLTLVKRHDDVVAANPRAVKRMLAKLGGDVDLFRSLCDLKKADALSQAPHCRGRADTAEELKRILDEILEANEAFSLKHLAINGHDVINLGATGGPTVGQALEATLEEVVDEQIPNEREALLSFVAQWLKQR